TATAWRQQRRLQSDRLRDIFGNPFRTVLVQPDWLLWKEGALVKVARAIYNRGCYEHLPLLGDLLQRAGCDDPEVLAHCRSPESHVRGCWVIDLLLENRDRPGKDKGVLCFPHGTRTAGSLWQSLRPWTCETPPLGRRRGA